MTAGVPAAAALHRPHPPGDDRAHLDGVGVGEHGVARDERVAADHEDRLAGDAEPVEQGADRNGPATSTSRRGLRSRTFIAPLISPGGRWRMTSVSPGASCSVTTTGLPRRARRCSTRTPSAAAPTDEPRLVALAEPLLAGPVRMRGCGAPGRRAGHRSDPPDLDHRLALAAPPAPQR